MIFALDKNLGFVVEDPEWQTFFKKFKIKPMVYDNMKKLTEEMEKNTVALSYLPAANFFYFRTDQFYTPIANALFTSNKTDKIGSLLIVSKQSPIQSLSQLKNKSLGYIHPYCTTSYFAPALLLWKNHYSIHHFFSSLREVGAWQLQIDAVVKGVVDATMIQEDIWYQLPENATQTKILDRQDHLPSPLILCASHLDKNMQEELKELLFSYKPTPPPHSLFNGFIPFEQKLVENFYSNASQAFA